MELNNFILWCKNWYQPINNKMDIITEAQEAGIKKALEMILDKEK